MAYKDPEKAQAYEAAYRARRRELQRERWATDPEFRQRQDERNRKWRETKREKHRAAARRWYAAYREQEREKLRRRGAAIRHGSDVSPGISPNTGSIR